MKFSSLSLTLAALLLAVGSAQAKRNSLHDDGVVPTPQAVQNATKTKTLAALGAELNEFEAEGALAREITQLQALLSSLQASMNPADAKKAVAIVSALQSQVEESSEFAQVLAQIKAVLSAANKALQADQTCNAPQVITQAGVTLTTPGFYCVANDLVFGTAGAAAITVASDGVTIDFDGHKLVLIDPTTVGISALNVTHLNIFNGIIENVPAGSTSANAAFLFDGVQQGYVDNFTARNNFYGAFVRNSTDIRFNRFYVNNSFGSNIRANENNRGFVVQNSTISNDLATQLASVGIRIGQSAVVGPNFDTTLENLEMYNAGIFIAQQATGAIVRNVNMVINDPNYTFNFLQGGAQDNAVTGISGAAFGFQITDSTFTNLNANASFSGIEITEGNGAFLQNLTIITNAAGDNSPITNPIDAGVGLEIGFDETPIAGGAEGFYNLTADNLLITGGSKIGIIINATADNPNRGITIKNSSVTDATQALITARNVTGLVIKNNELMNTPGAGLVLSDGVKGAAIVDNEFLNIGGATITAAPSAIFTTSGNIENNNAQVCLP